MREPAPHVRICLLCVIQFQNGLDPHFPDSTLGVIVLLSAYSPGRPACLQSASEHPWSASSRSPLASPSAHGPMPSGVPDVFARFLLAIRRTSRYCFKNVRTLPLKPGIKTVAGPLADQTRVLLDSQRSADAFCLRRKACGNNSPNAQITYVPGTQFLLTNKRSN